MTPERVFYPIPSERAEWLAMRQRYVGASEVAALFAAEPPYALGVYALWMVKAGRMEPPAVNHERAAWGLRLEEAIAAAAAAREGWSILPGFYATIGGLGATLDRVIEAPTEVDREALDGAAVGPGVLELKNVDWLVQRRQWKGEPPLHILLQLQAQLLATGYAWGAVAALVGGNDLLIYRYAARPKLHAEMLRRVAGFWASVSAGTPPKPDGSDATYRALVGTHEDQDEEAPADLAGDNEAPELAERYAAVSGQITALSKERDELRNRLIEKLAGHRYGFAGEWRIAAAYVPEKPGKVITPEMVGQVLPGRAASVRLIVSRTETTQ